MSKKIITLTETFENYQDVLEVVNEEVEGKQKKYLSGVWAQAEVVNGNGRWYQKKEMISEMDRFNKDVIPKRKALGELDHSKESNVMLSRSSHIFEEALAMDGGNLIGKARVLDTTSGKTLSVLIDEKVPFGVSSKGMGVLSSATKKGKRVKLVSSFQLRSPGDVVYNQSAPDAVPKVIIEMLMENDRRIYDIFNYELIEEVRKNMRSVMSYEIEEKIDENFSKLLNFNIKNK